MEWQNRMELDQGFDSRFSSVRFLSISFSKIKIQNDKQSCESSRATQRQRSHPDPKSWVGLTHGSKRTKVESGVKTLKLH